MHTEYGKSKREKTERGNLRCVYGLKAAKLDVVTGEEVEVYLLLSSSSS